MKWINMPQNKPLLKIFELLVNLQWAENFKTCVFKHMFKNMNLNMIAWSNEHIESVTTSDKS